MDTEEFLIARIGRIKLGINCHDVLNVYRQAIKIAAMIDQKAIFLGITTIANEIMPVIDLRIRAGVEATHNQSIRNIITFQTSLTKKFAVIVDEIVGMQAITLKHLQTTNRDLRNQKENLNLLFPLVAINSDGSLLHILDSTYLDKLDPIPQESGDLELF